MPFSFAHWICSLTSSVFSYSSPPAATGPSLFLSLFSPPQTRVRDREREREERARVRAAVEKFRSRVNVSSLHSQSRSPFGLSPPHRGGDRFPGFSSPRPSAPLQEPLSGSDTGQQLAIGIRKERNPFA